MTISLRNNLLVACSIICASPAEVEAKAQRAHAGAIEEQLVSLPTGDQLVIEQQDGSLQFAGHEIKLSGFNGIAGFSSEIAYLVVIEGRAQLGTLAAGRGKILLLPPYGKKPSVQRFDAGRLLSSLEKQPQLANSAALAQLGDLAFGQKRGIFLGRLGRTSFNVTTLGSADEELARRERVGGSTIRGMRFNVRDPEQDVEQSIVTRFLAALASGDAGTVAELLDPLPYGYGNMANGAAQARILMAQELIAQRDWGEFARTRPTRSGDTVWAATGAGSQVLIKLRRTTEFAFVQSISVRS